MLPRCSAIESKSEGGGGPCCARSSCCAKDRSSISEGFAAATVRVSATGEDSTRARLVERFIVSDKS